MHTESKTAGDGEQGTKAAARPEPTRELWESYRAMFDHFNRELFEGKLPEPVLNFSRHARSYGFFAPSRWNRGGDFKAKTHEISLNPDTLNGRNVKATASTLVHEMVHLWQREFGKEPRRCYHDKQWAAKMDSVGLVPSSTGKPGGKRVGVAVSHYIQDDGPFAKAFAKLPEAQLLPWRSGLPPLSAILAGELGGAEGTEAGASEAERPKKKDPSKVKYTCGGDCKVNVWGKMGLSLKCGECGEAFAEAA